jgi:hypothetical protein
LCDGNNIWVNSKPSSDKTMDSFTTVVVVYIINRGVLSVKFESGVRGKLGVFS